MQMKIGYEKAHFSGSDSGATSEGKKEHKK